MKYKIELIDTTHSDFFQTDSEIVPVYCLYKRRSIFYGWEVVSQSKKLDDLIKLAELLKRFNTIYL